MMNVATSGSAPLPSHFAPPARMPSTRRQLYHHPTLHMRSGSGSTLAHEFVPPQSPLSVQYSPPTSQQFPRTTSTQSLPQQIQHPAHAHSEQLRNSLQREPAGGSATSLTQYRQPHRVAGHRRQISTTTSTSNTSINHISSGHSQYPPSTPPMIQSRPNSMPSSDTYVARLRRAKATVWSARSQPEDLDRSNSKVDKYNKKYSRRGTPQKVIALYLTLLILFVE